MKKICLCFTFLLVVAVTQAQTSTSKIRMRSLIKEKFALADTQYRYMMSLTPPDKLPQSYEEKSNNFIFKNIGCWCSGFYPGSLWYIYEQTNDEVIKKEAEWSMALLEPNQTNTGTHDLGFMMYCSFGNDIRIDTCEEG